MSEGGGGLSSTGDGLANLTMKDQTVNYRGYQLTRDEIIAMRQILIDKVSETMKKSPFFKAILPEKIFTDMYQFYITVN